MLKQQTETETGWQHTPPTPAVPGRFDKDATRDILEMAACLQSMEQNTLSQAEIEQMAAEMGISPRHVRQAIALSGRQTANHPLMPIRLSRRQKLLALITPLVYGLYMATVAVVTRGGGSDSLITLSLFVLPAVIVAWLGWQLRYKRAGAAASVVFLLVMVCSIMAGSAVRDGRVQPLRGDDVLILMYLLAGGILAGAGGAALRQWLAQRQLPYVSTAVRPSDMDR